MSDSSTPFGTVALNNVNQTAHANALFDALYSVSIYAINRYSTSGTNLVLHGGKLNIGGVITTIAAPSVSLSTSTTTYLMASPSTGAVSSNTTGYTAGYFRIGRAVTGTSSITAWYDDRYLNFAQQTKMLTKAFPTDANYTATAAEVDVDVINISAGVVTATRDFIVPIAFPKQWTVINNTAQSVRIIGPTGTGITIATAKTAMVLADGTNVRRLTADV